MASTKKTRRFLRRMASRKDIGYREAMSTFYGKKLDELNQGLVRSLHKSGSKRSSELF